MSEPGEKPPTSSRGAWKGLSEADWQARLSPEQFKIVRKKGTERAFSGEYWDFHGIGTYHCVGCHAPLFASASKFDSGTGWPSFFQPVSPSALDEKADRTLWMTRTEVLCRTCGAHLGHVFPDGPQPTGKRFCINSLSLKFIGSEE